MTRGRGTADERSSTREMVAEHRRLSLAEGTEQWELDQLVEILRQRGTIDALAYVAEVEGDEVQS